MSGLLAIAWADGAERMRRFAFLVVVALALYAGYIYIPGVHASYLTISMNGHRGIYDSAYLGAAVTVLDVLFLSLLGFFFVRGSLWRDVELRTDAMVAATRVSNVTFVLGKWTSNVAVLAVVSLVTYAAGAVMQLWHGESHAIDPAAYLFPFVLVTLPAMAVVAAVAVAFDAITWLRGILGAGVYVFVVWSALLAVPIQASHDFTVHSGLDALGMTSITEQLNDAAMRAYPHDRGKTDIGIGGADMPKGGATTYRFQGMRWSASLIAERACTLLGAIALVVLSSVFFDRFRRERRVSERVRARFALPGAFTGVPGTRVLGAELALLMNGVPFWWLLGAAGLFVAELVVPIHACLDYVVPVALIWPLERLSQLGARERQANTLDMAIATAGFSWKTLTAAWCAGTLVHAAVLAAFLIRLLAYGQCAAAIALLCCLAAAVALALFLGTFTGAVRAFQSVVLIAWYLGPIQHLPVLDIAWAAQTHALVVMTIAGALALGLLGGTALLRARYRLRT